MAPVLMAVGAHADDIEFNVGGTLLKYRDAGYEVAYVMATNNMSGRWSHVDPPQSPPPLPMMERRKAEAAAGARALGTEPVHLDHPQRHWNRPEGGAAEVRYGCDRPEGVPEGVHTILTAHEDPDAVARLANLMRERDAECVLAHGPVQKDLEHVGVCLLVTKAYWHAVEQGYEGGLLYWRSGQTQAGAHHLKWTTHIDISGYLPAKIDLGALHKCQCPNPYRPDYPNRLRALAWGAATNCQAAEVFVTVRLPEADARGAFTEELLAHCR